MAVVQKLMRCEFRWNGPGAQQCSTSFHLNRDSHPAVADIDAVAAWLATAGAGTLRNTFLALLTSNELLREVTVSEVPAPDDPTALYYLKSVSINAAGTLATGDGKLPNEACATITLQSGFNSRRARGRMFLPMGQDAASMGGENWSSGSTAWTNLAAFVTALSTLLASSGAHAGAPVANSDLVVYSKRQWLEDNTINGFEVAAIRRNAKVHWLRSRSV